MKKKLTALILTIFVLLSSMLLPFRSYATEQTIYAQYSGTTTTSGYEPYCVFSIYSLTENSFSGNFTASNLGKYNVSQNVSGRVYKRFDSFTCYFSFKNYYNTTFMITVFPFKGYCECISSGNWHFADFQMTGTKISYTTNSEISGNSSFNESDLKMCMNLSEKAYKSIIKKGKSTAIESLIEKSDYELNIDDLRSYNYLNPDDESKKENIQNNVAFSLTYRKNGDNVDLFVIIRGSYNDEWIGNTQITGDKYDSHQYIHKNFKEAEISIKRTIIKYINDFLPEYGSDINLIITGHSRGAAVANLYAKEAIDKLNGDTSVENMPNYNSVTAYTFACPNVEKYNNTMENYSSIFNFCLYEDLVSTVPLTSPKTKWNYWKYGITYVTDLDCKYFWNNQSVSKKHPRKSIYAIHKAFSNWEDVEQYYNKKIGSGDDTTTLYEFLSETAGDWKAVDSKPNMFIRMHKLIDKAKNYPEIGDLLKSIATGADCVASHLPSVYASLINNYNNVDSNGVSLFRRYTYQNCLYDFDNMESFNEITRYSTSITDITQINQDNVTALVDFYNQNYNNTILDWNIDYPSTWTGITWNEDGNVEGIDLSFKNLSGSLDLSNFNWLKQLDVTGNNLTFLNLDNCSSLEEIDCSFNKLTALDLSDCTNLTSVTCCYNYLDTHEGGALYNTLDDLMFSDCYVNYYPQSVPDNAVFNTTELNALKTFAKANGNNSALDWLDSKGNIDTEKLQNNVLFEYDGSKYRIAAIDISDLDVSGSLNVTSLAMLKELYCENTKLTTLNVKGCTKLETLKCDGSRLTTLTLPSNAGAKTSTLYDVSCEYNYLDTAIFTENVVKYVEFKAGGKIEFENQKGDSSAMQAALYFANKLDEKDYSAESFEPLKELIDECNCYNYDNLYLNQDEIDEITTDILTAMYDLKAYFNISASVENGTLSMAYNDTTVNGDAKRSILYGTTVTLNATADSGYCFVGWYDEINNRYLSYEPQYIFKADSNLKLKAIIVPEGSATLTFANYSNWVAGTVTKTTAQWAEVSSISDLLPDVPYRYGYSNGKWVYDEQEILTKLRSGENVLITAEYTAGDTTMPTPRESTDTPLLDLYYKYDNDNKVGSFVMAAGFPENIHIESVGIAFYYKNADEFDPTDNFILLMNNKMLVSRFNTDTLEDIYIVNINKMSSKYNWAARGYVTYYNETGKLVTAYSNQINIIDTKNADEMNTLLENDGQSVNNNPKPNIEYGNGEDD